MRILVDSHVALWWLDDPARLSRAAHDAIADPGNEVFLSAASVWELALKITRGKLVMPDGFVDVLAEDGFESLPVAAVHALAAAQLPAHHGDPFDRMLVAQALAEGLVLATRDRILAHYDVPLLRA
jgi:PIN domain nuclease of toxin-antitoxin system